LSNVGQLALQVIYCSYFISVPFCLDYWAWNICQYNSLVLPV